MKPTVVVVIEGGLVHSAIADVPASVVVVDLDTEGADEDKVERISGIDSDVYVTHLPEPEIDPDFVGQFAAEKEDDEQWFRNHYTCPRCGHTWQDAWTAQCDDDCPSCGKRHISPTHSEDM